MPQASNANEFPVFRVAIALGDAERERTLLPALGEDSDLVIVDRCLSADQLLSLIERGGVDVVLIGDTLHRLNRITSIELTRSAIPIVYLTQDTYDSPWSEFFGPALPWDTDADSIRQTIIDALADGHTPTRHQSSQRDSLQHPAKVTSTNDPPVGRVIVVSGGHGSPGRTTVALNVATTLGMVAPAVIVDADLSAPSIAAHVDADPTRNLAVLAHGEGSTPEALDHALTAEIQPLVRSVSSCSLICGIPESSARSAISAGRFECLIERLQHRYQYVIIDTGANLVGKEASVHRSALRLADELLFVAGANLVSLWRAQIALRVVQSEMQFDPGHLHLVLNRCDRRYHHRVREIEWALGMAAAAVVPFDYAHMQRALAAQRPVVLDRHSRAGRALRELAAHVHRGKISLSRESNKTGQSRLAWRRLVPSGRKPRETAAKDGLDVREPLGSR